MSGKINEYSYEITELGEQDYLDVDSFTGSGYQSAKLKGENVLIQMQNAFGKSFGSFYDMSTQTCPSGGMKAMQVNNADTFNNGSVNVGLDSLLNPTLFSVSNSGIYNVMFSAQLNRTSGGSAQIVSIWLRKNGVDIPNTGTHVSVQANAGKLVASWNFFVDMTDVDNLQIMWSQNGAIEILTEPADLTLPHPAIPSVIVTINQV
jgi:hypothetical protein